MGKEAIKEDISSEDIDKQEVNVSESEQRAVDAGWKPKDDFDGPENEFIDYPEFNRRGELLGAIHKSNRKSKKLEEQIIALTEHNNKTAEAAYERALKALKDEKLAAAEDGDVKRVEEIRDEIESVKEQQSTIPAVTTSEDPYSTWKESNSEWYEVDEDLTDYAVGYGGRLERQHTDKDGNFKDGWTQEKVLAEITKKVKESFPDKFGNPKRNAEPTVARASNGSKSSRKKNIGFKDLDESGQLMYKKLVKTKTNPHGALTSDQYLKDYALAADLEWED